MSLRLDVGPCFLGGDVHWCLDGNEVKKRNMTALECWMSWTLDFIWLVSNIFSFSPLFGEDEANLTNIFQMGWNHQPVINKVGKILGMWLLFLPETNRENLSSSFEELPVSHASSKQPQIYKAVGGFPWRKCDVKHNTYLMGTTLDPQLLENCGVLQFLQGVFFVFFHLMKSS